MNESFLSPMDVVRMNPNKSFTESATSVVEDLIMAMPDNHSDNELKKWINEGVSCSVLRVNGGGWQKGKIKIGFTFIPDCETRKSNDCKSKQKTTAELRDKYNKESNILNPHRLP